MDTMDNLCTAKELAEKWGITVRMVTLMCTEGKIPGAKKFGNSWVIPKDTKKPLDGRTKEAKEAGKKENEKPFYRQIEIKAEFKKLEEKIK